MPYPCAGSNETICKIIMSSVPCGIGNRDGGINTSTFYCSEYSIIGRRSRHRLDILWKSAIPPENGSDENLMQGLMNRQQAPARLMRESHHVAVAYGIIRP